MLYTKILLDNGDFEIKEATANEIREESARLQVYAQKGEQCTSPSATLNIVQELLNGCENERFVAVLLDTQHRVIDFKVIAEGTINAARIYPREVVKAVFEFNASAVIFAHNHPSGDPEPSQADMRITRKLSDALDLIDVRVLDHFVIGANANVSFAERGWI